MNFAKFGKIKRFDLFPQLLDVHVPRMIEAHRVLGSYMRVSTLLDHGLIRKEKFLGNDSASEIKAQAEESVIRDGQGNDSRVANLPDGAAKRAVVGPIWEEITKLFQSRAMSEVGKLYIYNSHLQHLLNSPDDEDEQKVFHGDTFFPCVKSWYFPHAVTLEGGPLWYVPKSPRLTPELIEWHEERVIDLKLGRAESWRGPGHREGSFRISAEELKELEYKPEPVTVEADTLVIANVFGFHRRGDTTKPTHRVSIHSSIRINNPFGYA